MEKDSIFYDNNFTINKFFLFLGNYNWWCRKINNKLHGPHVLEIIHAQYEKRRPIREHWCGATNQIPSEGQVRTSHNSRVPELEWIMRTLVHEGLMAFIIVGGWHLFLGLEVFSL